MSSPDPASRAFEEASLGPLHLRNRLIRTAAFEGMSPAGAPSPELVEHHRRMAAGGVGLTTVAYCSVSPEGRTYGHQLLMRPEIVGRLRELTDAVHREGAAASLQLGHAGYFASPKVIGTRPWGPSRLFNTYGLSWCRPIGEADIRRVIGDFARAARLAAEAGFDAVELHAGHGYLLSQFLSPYTNRRRDGWGGDWEGRLRLPLEVLGQIRAELPPRVALLCKMNLRDGFAGGLELDEAVAAARRFAAGGADALVLSGGFVSRTPFYMLRGNLPVREMVAAQPSRVSQVGLSLFGRWLVPSHPFEELFFLSDATRVRAAVGVPLVLVGGVCSRGSVARAVAAGFDFVAMGRALIMDPDFAGKLGRGETERSECDQCNHCIAEMDQGGVRCPHADESGRRRPGRVTGSSPRDRRAAAG